jgi:prevent-host-death family protein
MTISTFSSRDFNQDVGGAKKAAESGPVFITDRGKPAHVLLSYSLYKKLTSERSKIADLLNTPVMDDIEFDIPQFVEPARAADLN